ncbi:Aste57867_13897 [Aphanomyces stellatus]|uniref:Aste57867_13897 protein n=1 Tax=Aphanomyces stellatus TaxID=120398 RepID=A0A485KZL6_9STRA|nr:hypothetical protein As57867_013846 [Aphanomyces stellatus]VFT90728.1 Aste57867_13897 [Aphanomyces stellatus]
MKFTLLVLTSLVATLACAQEDHLGRHRNDTQVGNWTQEGDRHPPRDDGGNHTRPDEGHFGPEACNRAHLGNGTHQRGNETFRGPNGGDRPNGGNWTIDGNETRPPGGCGQLRGGNHSKPGHNTSAAPATTAATVDTVQTGTSSDANGLMLSAMIVMASAVATMV